MGTSPGRGRAGPARRADRYATPGPWAGTPCEDHAVEGCTIVSPARLGAHGHRHAVVVWGNGTAAPTAVYRDWFGHLASWGFVVVASDDGWVGAGTELAAARDAIGATGATPGPRYTGAIDPARIGVMGHSQGAGGALWAALDRPTGFAALATWALPDTRFWCNAVWPPPAGRGPCRPPPTPTELHRLTRPAFLVHGDADPMSTARGDARPSGPGGVFPPGPGHDYWRAHLGGRACVGTLAGAGHADLDAAWGATTAWFRHTLAGDPVAAAVFADVGTGTGTGPGGGSDWSAWDTNEDERERRR